MKDLSDFTSWLKAVLPPEQLKQLPAFLDWLASVRNEPEGLSALLSLEEFARRYAPNTVHNEAPSRWGWRWLVLSALEGCLHARRFHEGGDRLTLARQVVSEYRRDKEELQNNLKGALAIIRRHDRQGNPVLWRHLFELESQLFKNNIHLYEEREIVHCDPGVVDDNGIVHFDERTVGRGRALTAETIVVFLETFLDVLASPNISEIGAHRLIYGCLFFLSPRTDRHKKPVATDTMLAALLVTLFEHYRRGLPDPLSRWTRVEMGTTEAHTLTAELINATLPIINPQIGAMNPKSIRDRLRNLLKDNPGLSVTSWSSASAT